MNNANNAEIFLDLYKTLEQVISSKYNLNKNDSPINYILGLKAYSAYKEELYYCKDVRNFLSHEPKIDKEFAIIPSDEMIELIWKIIKMINSAPTVEKILKKVSELYFVREDDYVLSALRKLSHKLYTHIPIMKNNKVIGVLSKDSVFNYLLDNDFEKIDSDKKFKDIKEYTKLDNDKYLFIDKNITIDEIIVKVEDLLKKGNRVAYIFVSKDGTKDSDLIGLFTPLDLLGY